MAKKLIKPQFLFNKSGKASHVYLNIEDYNTFMTRLKKLSKQARASSKRINEKKLLSKMMGLPISKLPAERKSSDQKQAKAR